MNAQHWHRVPLWATEIGDGSPVDRKRATCDLLRRWHIGDVPKLRELMRAWGWSHDRVHALAKETWEWAGAAGAARPPLPLPAGRTKAHTCRTLVAQEPHIDRTPTAQEPHSNRTPDDTSDADNQEATAYQSHSNRTAIAQEPHIDRTLVAHSPHTPRARLSLETEEDQILEEIQRERRAGGALSLADTHPFDAPHPCEGEPPPSMDAPEASAPPWLDPSGFGATPPPIVEQDTPCIIEPPRTQTAPIGNPGDVVSSGGDLLSLLTGAGMNIATASIVLRKLQGKGIETLDDAIKGDVDVFLIGSIVGVWKVLTVKAFRAGGWLPPNERPRRVLPVLGESSPTHGRALPNRNQSFIEALENIPEREPHHGRF